MDRLGKIAPLTQIHFSRNLVDRIPFPVMIHAEDGTVLTINKSWTDITGYSHDEIPTMTKWVELAYRHLDKDIEPIIQEVRELFLIEQTRDEGIFRITTKAGKERSWDFTSTPIGTIDDGRKVIMSIARDVSDNQLMKEQLLESEKLYRGAFETNHDGRLININGVFMECNEALVRMLGYTHKNEVIGQGPGFMLDEASTQIVTKYIDNYQSYSRVKMVGKKADGSLFPIEVSARLITYQKQHARFITIRDISRQIKNQQMMEESRLRYKTLVEASFEAIIVYDVQTQRISNHNNYAEQMLGSDLLSKTFLSVSSISQPLTDDRDAFFSRQVEKTLNGEQIRFEWDIIDKTGEIIPAEVRMNKIPVLDREEIRIMVIDRSEVKQYQDQLKRLNTELRRSNHELEQFAYVASHDLQEPLGVIQGFIQLLAQDYQDHFDQEGEYMMTAIEHATQQMQRLIDDILRFSRLDKEREFERTAIDLKQLLKEVEFNLSNRIKETQTILDIGELPTIMGNETDMLLVFQNLLSNGIKFNLRQPHISITSVIEDDSYIIRVEDNGIGIPEEHHEDVFTIFKRLHNQQEYNGSGIGLATCKKILSREGGKIWITRPENKESTIFNIRLPIS